MRTINQAGLNLIKVFESLRLEVYTDLAGINTVGWGCTTALPLGTKITLEKAQELLEDSVRDAESDVTRRVGAYPLTSNEFSALVSLVYNVGHAPLDGHLGANIRAARYPDAAEEFLNWNHVHGVVVEGLSRRRAAERALFLTPDMPEAV